MQDRPPSGYLPGTPAWATCLGSSWTFHSYLCRTRLLHPTAHPATIGGALVPLFLELEQDRAALDHGVCRLRVKGWPKPMSRKIPFCVAKIWGGSWGR